MPTRSGLVRVKIGGHGSPTAVFIGGVGEGLNVWSGVLDDVAAETSAISYDRLGLGRAGPAPANAPRDSVQIARELHELLIAMHEHEPVVLVAHSAGAFHARMFAHLFPQLVAGLVLVEPAHEDWLDELRTQEPKAWLEHMRWRATARHSPGRKRELLAWNESVQQMRTLAAPFPPVPTTLISATKGNSPATRVLFALHQRWVQANPSITHVITDAAGHHVQRDAPEVVVNAVVELLCRLTERRRAGCRAT